MRRKHIPPVVRGFVTRVCTVFGQFCTEGITFSVGSRPSDRVRGQSSRPWDNKGPGLKKHFFSTLWASVWSKNKGGPGPLPLICHWHVLSAFTHTVMSYEQDIKQLSSESSNNNFFLGAFWRYNIKTSWLSLWAMGGGGGDFPWLPWWWPLAIFIGNKMKMRPKEHLSPPAYCAKLQICINLPSLATYDRKPFQCLNLVLITEH